MDAALSHKAAGNAAFKAGDRDTAVGAYSSGVAALAGVRSPESRALLATLQANLAAVHLGAEDHEAAVQAATACLEVDGGHPKGLYRRAVALEALGGRSSEAFRDAAQLVKLEPKNKTAVALARRLQADIRKESEVDAASRLVALLRKAPVSGAADVAPGGAQRKLMMSVAGMAAQGEADARALIRRGVLPVLWPQLPACAAAIHPLRAIAQQSAQAASAVVSDAAADFAAVGRVAVGDTSSDADVVAALALLRHGVGVPTIAPAIRGTMVDAVAGACLACVRRDDTTTGHDVAAAALSCMMITCDTPGVAMAMASRGALEALLALADHGSTQVRSSVSLAVGRLLAGLPEERAKAELTRVVSPALKGADVHVSIAAVAVLRAVAMANFGAALWALKEGGMLDDLCDLTRRLPARAQALCIDVFAQVAADEQGRVLCKQDVVVSTMRVLLQCDTPEVRSAATVFLSRLRAVETMHGFDPENPESLVLIHAVFDVISKARVAAAEVDADAAPEGPGAVVACAVESLSFMLTSTRMKELLVEQENVLRALVALCEGADFALGYGLASIFRELTMSKNFHVEEKLKEMEVDAKQWEEFQKMTKQKGETPEGEDDDEVLIAERVRALVDAGGTTGIVRLCTPASPATASSVGAGASGARGRGDDAGSEGRASKARQNTQAALAQALLNIATHAGARGRMAQEGGLASCLVLIQDAKDEAAAAAAVEDAHRAEKEKEQRRGEEGDGQDGHGEETEKKVGCGDHKQAKGAKGAMKPSSSKSPGTTPVSMHGRGPTARVMKTAAHALAKVLITTNPTLLPQARVMDALGPLVDLCRSNDQLPQFEALLAITNILSLGLEYKERAAKLHGVRAFEFCQFSDNLMVRRAGTEALSNMIPCEAMFEHMKTKTDRTKLWLGLVEDWGSEEEGAYETARAAAGGLAMLCEDPDVAKLVIASDGLAMMLALLQSGNVEMQHRAAACLLGLVHTPEGATIVRGSGDAGGVGGAVGEGSMPPPSPAPKSVATEILAALLSDSSTPAPVRGLVTKVLAVVAGVAGEQG